jgi:hypothetical protein
LFSTNETVAVDTPARSATSRMVERFMRQAREPSSSYDVWGELSAAKRTAAASDGAQATARARSCSRSARLSVNEKLVP